VAVYGFDFRHIYRQAHRQTGLRPAPALLGMQPESLSLPKKKRKKKERKKKKRKEPTHLPTTRNLYPLPHHTSKPHLKKKKK